MALLTACPGAIASADDTPWTGWRTVGPPSPPSTAASSSARGLYAAGTTTLLIDESGFAASDGRRRVVGRVPVAPEAVRDSTIGDPAVLPSGRIVVPGREAIATTDDLGRRWRSVPLPSRIAERVGRGLRTGPIFTDATHGIVLVDTPPVPSGTTPPPEAQRTGPAVVATDDGGETWTIRVPAEPGVASTRSASPAPRAALRPATPRTSDPGPPPPASRVSVQWLAAVPGGYVRLVAGSGGLALERSGDGGTSWQAVPVPGRLQSGGPSVRTPGATASGAVILPVGDVLLVSTDGLRSVTSVVPPGRDPRVLCDPAGSCLVDVLDPALVGRRIAVPFDGASFGSPQPALPRDAVAPAPGVVLGLAGATDDTSALVRSVDGGRTFAPAGVTGAGRWVSSGDGRLVVRELDGALRATRDGRSWSSVPRPPSSAPVTRVADAPGGLVALTADDRVWRRQHGAWSSWDAASIRPTDLTASSAAVVVIGERGILRRAGGRVRRTLTVRDRVIRGALGVGRAPLRTVDGLSGVASRGRLVLAWTGDDDRYTGEGLVEGGLLRSTDGGRTWRLVRGVAPTDDLQIASGRTVLRTFGSGLYVSQDRGRRFALRGRIPQTGYLERAELAFDDARRGVVGGALTVDGGRTLTPLPRIGDGAVLRRAGSGLLVAGPLGTPLLHPTLLRDVRPARVALRIAGRRPAAGAGGRALVVAGRVVGVPAGTPVTILGAKDPLAPRGSRATETLVTDDAGAFRGRVRTVARDRVLRAEVHGNIGVDRTTLGGQSRWIGVGR